MENSKDKKLGDVTRKVSSGIAQLVTKLMEDCINQGALSLSNDRQFALFRKGMLDNGNNTLRKIENILEPVKIIEIQIDKFDFSGKNGKGGTKS